jgi:polysaccharide biosynthesis protein PslJ
VAEIALDTRRRPPVAASVVVLAALLILTCAVVVGHGIRLATPLAAVAVAGTVVATKLRSWRALISLIVVVILFIPVNRYTLPASLPVRLEPYRLIVAIVALFWLTSALIDPRVRLRSTGVIDAPLVVYLLAVVGSEIVNSGRVSTVAPDVVKALLFLASFIVILFLVPSLLRSLDDIDFVVRVLVGGGAVVALFALIESRTSYNVFDHLSQVIPALHFDGGPEVIERGSRLRVFASSQHPIALGAALAMLVPLGVYTSIRTRRLRWWIATSVLLLGTLATVSRTAIVMLGVIGLVFLWLRSREVKRLWPLIIPALLVIHIALPGAIGSFRQSFAPTGGIVAQQQNAAVGSGRLSTFGPAIHTEFTPHPILGEGFGTRITTPDQSVPVANGPILDDQWLGTLLETGVVGVAALLWLFVRFVRRLGKKAKLDRTPRGWLLAAIAAAVAAFAESMLTYDALSFVQVTFLLFIFLGLGCAAYSLPDEPQPEAVEA